MRELSLHPEADGKQTESFVARLKRAGSSSGALTMLLLLSLIFALATDDFLAPANLINVGTQSTILLLLALPMTFIIMTEGLDLSMGAVLTLANVVLAVVAIKTGGVLVPLLAALGVGLVFGLANGTLVTHMGIPPFVATLGTLGAAQGLALVVTDGQSVVGLPPEVLFFYSGVWLGLPLPIWIAAAVFLIFYVLLYHTRFGTNVFALGGNREALTLVGVRVNVYLVTVYAIGGLMAGFAALLLTARISSGHPTAALGMEFDAIAAVAVGGTSFERGRGWLNGTLIGVLTIGVLRNGLNLLGLPSAVQVSAIGLLVILALMIDAAKSAHE